MGAAKIFLGVMIAVMVLGIGCASTKCTKRILAVLVVCYVGALTAITIIEHQQIVTAVAPETGKIKVEQDTWGTITVTDETGTTKEYQGCIHISGKYKYKTKKYMGLCVSVDDALVTGEWSPGKYKQYYESKGKYWEARNEKETKTTDE